MNTEWCTGYFVGVNGKTTEYLVATSDGIFSCATIRRLADEEAYDPECIRAVQMTYREYILEGARSSPIGVRFGETNIKNADPIAGPMIPRRARLKPEDFETEGYLSKDAAEIITKALCGARLVRFELSWLICSSARQVTK